MHIKKKCDPFSTTWIGNMKVAAQIFFIIHCTTTNPYTISHIFMGNLKLIGQIYFSVFWLKWKIVGDRMS